MRNNFLKIVFWDYPELTVERNLIGFMKTNKAPVLNWVLYRFLEYGRAIDTLKYFKISEVKKNINQLKLRPSTKEKWHRLIEVYDND